MTDEEIEIELKAQVGCFLSIISLAMVVPAMILDGYVLSALWGWFVAVPLALPRIGIATAIGIAMIARLVTHYLGVGVTEESLVRYKKQPIKEFVKSVSINIFVPIILLLMGWIVQGYQ